MAKRTEKKMMEVETVVYVCDRCSLDLHGPGWTRTHYVRLGPTPRLYFNESGVVELCDTCAEWFGGQLPGLKLEKQEP